jgi:hypothetical protein
MGMQTPDTTHYKNFLSLEFIEMIGISEHHLPNTHPLELIGTMWWSAEGNLYLG